MIDVAVLRAMAAAGAGVEAIIAAVEASQKIEEEAVRERREKDRKRKRAARGSDRPAEIRVVPRTTADKSENQTISTVVSRGNPRTTADPPHTPPIDNIIILDSASQGLPPSAAERKVINEYDLVLSDGTTIITSEEFEALNQEFGITNSRDLAGMAKRTFLKDARHPRHFITAFRTFLTNKKNKGPRVAKPTPKQVASARDQADADYAERQRRLEASKRYG